MTRFKASGLGRFSVGVLFSLLAACAGLEAPSEIHRVEAPAIVQDCATWFADLDRRIDLAGTRDAGASRVSGFPYLRVDRLTASFAPQAQWDERRFDAWF
ncbi:MAG: hypothetical protein FJX47_10135, partial [Alphaproteobacteria bacterium]|nr:hypothetical protein [Alphaproteobacteria bacterium]